MNKTIALALLLSVVTFAAPVRNNQETTEFMKMEQILRAATARLPGADYRVVFSAEGNRDSFSIRHWVASVHKYPADYKVMDEEKIRIAFSAPPCHENAAEFCSIKEIPGQPLFIGRFELDGIGGHFHRFDGNVISTASRMAAFREQLNRHREWTQADLEHALAADGAQFGPDKEEQFRAALMPTFKVLEKAFGPMRVHRVVSIPPHLPEVQSKPTAPGWPLYWKVVAIPLRSPKERVVMYFEPFAGELQQVYVTGLFSTWDSKAKKFKREYLDPDLK